MAPSSLSHREAARNRRVVLIDQQLRSLVKGW